MSGPNVAQKWAFQNFYSFFKGMFPSATEQHIAAATGIPASTAKKHLTGECRPGAEHMLAYVSVFGARFLHAVMGEAPTSIAEAAHAERLCELEQQAREIGEQLAALS